jgi:hypothetical protein
MTQRELNQAVARATGEDLREIRRRGFSIVNPDALGFDPEPDLLPPSRVDWDSLDVDRTAMFRARQQYRQLAPANA